LSVRNASYGVGGLSTPNFEARSLFRIGPYPVARGLTPRFAVCRPCGTRGRAARRSPGLTSGASLCRPCGTRLWCQADDEGGRRHAACAGNDAPAPL